MKRVLAGVLFVFVFATGGCGGAESAHNERAKEEQEICFEQAEEVAATRGAGAGGEHLDGCVESYAHEVQVEE